MLKLRNLMINLLTVDNAPTLVEPTSVGGASAGSRALYTIRVVDAHAAVAELKKHGVTPLNSPIDRPWGRRTAAFADPAGNVWEIAQLVDSLDTPCRPTCPSITHPLGCLRYDRPQWGSGRGRLRCAFAGALVEDRTF